MNIDYATDALIVIDMQNDFGDPNGSLYVKDGEKLVEPIMNMCNRFTHTFFTQDMHPRGHFSFASANKKKPFDVIEMYGHSQVMWPDHCVMGSSGVEIMGGLNGWSFLGRANAIIRKGMNVEVDSYSAFNENFGPGGKRTTTGFAGLLRELGIKRCFFVGLARDYCVRYSAEDASSEGFQSYIIDDLTKSVDPASNSVASVTKSLTDAGIKFIKSSDFQ